MDSHFPILTTADGSPTLKDKLHGEAMHSRQGAFLETLYNYDGVIDFVFSQNIPATFCVVGLGLGYIEMLIAARAFQCVKWNEVKIYSFELCNDLRTFFEKWLNNSSEQTPLTEVYNSIARRFEKHFELPPESVHKSLSSLFVNSQLQLQPALTSETFYLEKFSGIFFDAYSAASSPELWSEEFFHNFFKLSCWKICAVASYASRATLKKSLTAENFTIVKKSGFAGKRECTFAFRGK